MNMQTIPHPLKEELRQRKIRLWMISKKYNVPESKLSRYLNGIDPMPLWLEQLLWGLVIFKPIKTQQLQDGQDDTEI